MVSETVQSAVADEVFHALSDPTRRKVLEHLSVGPATVSELAAPFDMQLPSFVQHLSVLEQSRLARSKKRGRVRTYEMLPERFKVVEDWLAQRHQPWEARLDRFDQYVKQLKEKESARSEPTADLLRRRPAPPHPRYVMTGLHLTDERAPSFPINASRTSTRPARTAGIRAADTAETSGFAATTSNSVARTAP